MSSMLDQVIVDAEALKEVAIKNAEATIVEKYSNDIKKAVDQLLEQGPGPSPEEMAMMGATGDAPGGAVGGMALPGTPDAPGGMDAGSGEDVGPSIPDAQMDDPQKTVTINLSELVQEMKMDDLDPSEKQMHELVAEEVTGGEEVAAEEGREVITIQESVIADILGEDLEEDVYEEDVYEEGEDFEEDVYEEGEDFEEDVYEEDVYDSSPYEVGVMEEQEKQWEAIDKLQRALQVYQHDYAKLYESHQAYEQEHAQLYQQAGQLHEQNNKFREMLVKTQEKLNEVNVRNAHLHYTNRTLISDSLNERQKDKIVEAIGKAGTVEEAKIIFETLQSAVAGIRSIQDTPKSLDEAINKRSSAFLPRKEEKQSDPSFTDRMQRLAGIK